jgi:hypothetical protein
MGNHLVRLFEPVKVHSSFIAAVIFLLYRIGFLPLSPTAPDPPELKLFAVAFKIPPSSLPQTPQCQ